MGRIVLKLYVAFQPIERQLPSGPVDVEITLPEYQGHKVICAVINGLGKTESTHTFPLFSFWHTLDVSTLAPGLYVVQLVVDGRVVQVERLVVQ
ncbi:MAG: hypothetical protein H6568_13665 [Lewinellaceae bacterium]|nr:hypothetical protein [Lewinellaceae bacterium]